MKGKFLFQFILIFLIFLIVSCVPGKTEQKIENNNLRFRDLEEFVTNENINSIVIFYGGEIIWDYYSENWSENMIHAINSCTKSIVSLLIGTLIDQGLISDIDIPVYTLFPELDLSDLQDENKKLTLKHFLTMSTGLASRDSYKYNWEGLKEIWTKEEWVKKILFLVSEFPGGIRFEYSNLASFLLGEVIRSQTGMDVSLYAEQTLFQPLGIGPYHWDTNYDGQSLGYAGLYMRPVDLAKIGQLVLQQGKWQGEQIVSAKWIEESTSVFIEAGTLREFYGYQWWIDKTGRYLALGYEGQYLIIDPKLDLVTVFFSKLEDYDFFLPYKIYKNYIIPEIERVTGS